MRRAATVVALAILSSLVAAAAVAAEPARIGVVLPLEGEHGRLGKAALDGLRWGIETAGAEGAIELEVRDSGGTAAGAAAAVSELAARPDIVAVIGPVGGGESSSAAEIAQAEQVPLLTLTSVDDIERYGSWIFRLRLSPEDQARALARVAAKELGVERAAVFYPSHDYGESCAQAFVEAFAAAGGRVTALEAYAPDDSRPSEEAELLSGRRMRRLDGKGGTKVEVRKRSAAHVDFEVLFIPDTARAVARDLAFLELAGVDLGAVQLLGTSAWASGSLAGAEGRASGALVARLFDPYLSEAVEVLVEVFVERHARQPTELEAQAHDGMRLAIAAVERCGGASAERGCVQQALRSGGARVEGVTGSMSLTAEGGLRRAVYLFEVDGAGELHPAY